MRDTRSSGIIWETQVTSRWMPDIYHYQTAPESCLHAYRAGRQLHNMLNEPLGKRQSLCDPDGRQFNAVLPFILFNES